MAPKQIETESIVLVSVHDGESVRDSGTGFIIGKEGNIVYVMTCAHVVSLYEKVTNNIQVKVNGIRVNDWYSGLKFGIDIAVLLVPNLNAGPELTMASGESLKDKDYYYYGFSQFSRSEYVKELGEGRFSKILKVISPSHGDSILYHKMKSSEKGSNFKKGHSGAPILLTGSNKVVAVARLKDSDGKEGYAIDISEVSRIWQHFDLPINPFTKAGSQLEDSSNRPPPPPDIKNEDDPQLDRWNGDAKGVAEKNGRRLRAKLVKPYSQWFTFDAIVESTDPSKPLKGSDGPFVFHLHDSYPRWVIWVRNVKKGDNTARLEEITSTGVYTLAVQVKDDTGKWIGLEYNLKDLPGLDKKFKSR